MLFGSGPAAEAGWAGGMQARCTSQFPVFETVLLPRFAPETKYTYEQDRASLPIGASL